jgi:hypothetical protein
MDAGGSTKEEAKADLGVSIPHQRILNCASALKQWAVIGRWDQGGVFSVVARLFARVHHGDADCDQPSKQQDTD